jgi:hypothetical protein
MVFDTWARFLALRTRLVVHWFLHLGGLGSVDVVGMLQLILVLFCLAFGGRLGLFGTER